MGVWAIFGYEPSIIGCSAYGNRSVIIQDRVQEGTDSLERKKFLRLPSPGSLMSRFLGALCNTTLVVGTGSQYNMPIFVNISI